MIELVSRLFATAIGTIIGREWRRLLRSMAFGFAAAAFAVGMIVFLIMAAYFWLSAHYPPIESALAMAGGFLVLVILCVLLLALSGSRRRQSGRTTAAAEIAPLVELLKAAGCDKEAAALAAGTQLAGQIRPYYLVIAAVGVGLILGRRLGRYAPSEKSPPA